jgi:endoglucanase
MNKAILWLVLLMCSTVVISQDWHVEYRTPDSFAQDNWIKVYVIIYNNSGTNVPLSDLTIRYWYTTDGPENDELSVWWAQVGSGNVTGTFQDISPAQTGADRYCELGFTSGAGTLQNGTSSGGVQCAWHKSNWASYDETDDYSVDHTIQTYTTWDKVGLYYNGTLVWGVEPGAGGEPTAEVTPDPADVTPDPTAEVTSDPTAVATPEVTAVVTPTPGQDGGIFIEAEDYIDYSDTTTGNDGGAYRSDDVDIGYCPEGGYFIGWVAQGEWLEYTLTINTAGYYTIYTRIGSPHAYSQGFYITIDGIDVTDWLDIPDTGAWAAFQDVTVQNVPIDAGTHTLRLELNADFAINYIYITSESNPPAATLFPWALPTSTPPPDYSSVVSQYGQLQVIGSSLCDENGNEIRLKGMGTHGLQWHPIVTDHTIYNLVYDWNVQVIRPAMYIEEYKDGNYWGGYEVHPDYMKGKLIELIEDALDVGIYILIDWHIHNDPTNFTSLAIDFYEEMATTYGGYPNIIYEICNEPEYVSWDIVKTYVDDVIPVIRAIDPDNIIIVGTPSWCQDLDIVANDPLTGYTDIMYALHFYAGSHQASYRDKAQAALDAGLPVIVTEWGTTNYTGGSDGMNYFPESTIWIDWMRERNISWINWNFSFEGGSSSALLPGANLGGPWADADLSASGTYIKNLILNDVPPPEPTIEGTPVPPPAECESGTPISPDFVSEGVGEYCWEAESLGSYINSWNLDALTINGVDYSNMWASSSQLPDKINGLYYVYFKSSVASGHFEARN